MSTVVVLDAEALSALSRRRGERFDQVKASLKAAVRLNRAVITPAVILAELYRGPQQNQVVDACLSRETGIGVRDTDRSFARLVGSVLAASGAESTDLADAHAVAAAVDAGGGVIITGDESDMVRLAAPYRNVTVAPI